MRFSAENTKLAQRHVARVVKRVSLMRRHNDDVAGLIGVDPRARVALTTPFQYNDHLLDCVHVSWDLRAIVECW